MGAKREPSSFPGSEMKVKMDKVASPRSLGKCYWRAGNRPQDLKFLLCQSQVLTPTLTYPWVHPWVNSNPPTAPQTSQSPDDF